MELDISTDEEGNLSVSRSSFTKFLIQSLIDYFDDKLIVKSINSTSIEVEIDGKVVVYGLSDETLDLELRLIIFILITAHYYTTPKILFHIKSDQLGDYLITGLSISDFSGIMMSTENNDDQEYTITLGSRYLFNLFRMNGIFSLKYIKESRPSKLPLIPVNESDERIRDNSNLSIEVKKRLDDIDQREVKLKRIDNMSAHLNRKLASKMRWKLNRSKYITGINKFHNSLKGKISNTRKGERLSRLNELKRDGKL